VQRGEADQGEGGSLGNGVLRCLAVWLPLQWMELQGSQSDRQSDMQHNRSRSGGMRKTPSVGSPIRHALCAMYAVHEYPYVYARLQPFQVGQKIYFLCWSDS